MDKLFCEYSSDSEDDSEPKIVSVNTLSSGLSTYSWGLTKFNREST